MQHSEREVQLQYCRCDRSAVWEGDGMGNETVPVSAGPLQTSISSARGQQGVCVQGVF